MMSDDHNYFEESECPTALSEETVLCYNSFVVFLNVLASKITCSCSFAIHRLRILSRHLLGEFPPMCPVSTQK